MTRVGKLAVAESTKTICDQSSLGRGFMGRLYGHWSCETRWLPMERSEDWRKHLFHNPARHCQHVDAQRTTNIKVKKDRCVVQLVCSWAKIAPGWRCLCSPIQTLLITWIAKMPPHLTAVWSGLQGFPTWERKCKKKKNVQAVFLELLCRSG